MTVEAGHGTGWLRAAPGRSRGTLVAWSVLGAATLVQAMRLPHPDVAWLSTMAKQLVDGAVLYRDVADTNPPMSPLLYVPVEILRRASGLPLGAALSAMMLALFLATVEPTVALLRRLDGGPSPAVFRLMAVFALFVLPAAEFGQREQIATLLLLPALALAALRAAGGGSDRAHRAGTILPRRGRWWRSRRTGASSTALPHGIAAEGDRRHDPLPPLRSSLPEGEDPIARDAIAEGRRPTIPIAVAVAVGLAAGLAVSVKPPFALALALPFVGGALVTGRLRMLVAPEAVVAAVVLLVYGAATLVFLPAFVAVWLPLLLDTYRAVNAPILTVTTTPVAMAGVLGVAAAGLLGARAGSAGRLPLVLAAAGAGFWLAGIEQSKGWPNHFLPSAALSLLALGLLAASTAGTRRLAAIAAIAASASHAVPALATRLPDSTALAPLIRAEAPPRPRLLVVSGGVAVGHPLTEVVGAEWLNTSVGPWVSEFARRRLATETLDAETRRRLLRADAEDRARFRADFFTGDPDVILIDRGFEDWLAWAREDPAVARGLEGYEKRGEAMSVEAWFRRGPRGTGGG